MIVVSDTSAITNLAAIHHVHLLAQLYRHVTIPEAVYRELTASVPPAPETLDVQSTSWLHVKRVTDLHVVERLQYEAR